MLDYLSATLATLHLLFRNFGCCRGRCASRLREASQSQQVHVQQNKITITHLSLLHLLLFLFRLRLGDSIQSCLTSHGSGLVPLRSNGSQISTNNPPLVLHRTSRAFLRNFFGDTLLVHAAVDLGPGDLTRVFALQEERCVFGGCETEDLSSQFELNI
jgi:hypothetical protein